MAVPETHVLAIASHVTSGYVGNTMAGFCMQVLGCEVSAIHTVNYSNHVGYKQFTGRKSSPEEIDDLLQGLRKSKLDDFDVLLSGYCPSATIVERVGRIARELKLKATTRPGTFFWVLDPVMGDNGRIYVAEDTVPAYKSLLRDADLILPNQFEAELLSEVKINDLSTMQQAITKLHEEYQVPHIIVTSIKLPPTANDTPGEDQEGTPTVGKLSIIGSTRTSDLKPRMFRITVPAYPVFFSGTGDMFAALMVARLREAAQEAELCSTASWRSPDEVSAVDLPLAKAAEKTLASMHAVLKDTAQHYDEAVQKLEDDADATPQVVDTTRHLRLTRAAEVRVVRNTQALLDPPNVGDFRAESVAIEE